MKKEGKIVQRHSGMFLAVPHTWRRRQIVRCCTVVILLGWDGLLLYMIVHCLIEPVYGAVFVAAISVCLGYQL